MHKFNSKTDRYHEKMSLIEDWWDALSLERPSHQTISPYFRCNIGLIDNRLDPDINHDCERFVATMNGRILVTKPGNTPIWVCENCYDKVKNNPRAYDIYGDKVCCVHNRTVAVETKNNETDGV